MESLVSCHLSICISVGSYVSDDIQTDQIHFIATLCLRRAGGWIQSSGIGSQMVRVISSGLLDIFNGTRQAA